jgi:hypothetical protein
MLSTLRLLSSPCVHINTIIHTSKRDVFLLQVMIQRKVLACGIVLNHFLMHSRFASLSPILSTHE